MVILPLRLTLALVVGQDGFRWLVYLQVGLTWLAAVIGSLVAVAVADARRASRLNGRETQHAPAG